VVRLEGIDFDGVLDSPELGYSQPFDPRFAKMMVRTASYLLGGDAGGLFAFAEHFELSVLLHRDIQRRWKDANALQCFLVGLASTRLSGLIGAEAIFGCSLFAFNSPEVAISYFMWRRQEANLRALDRYCSFVLSRESSPEKVAKLLEGLGPLEKEEILRQHDIDYRAEVPGWQRDGAGVHLSDSGVVVDTSLPAADAYAPYLSRYIG
jgi:tRNA(His) 5'-end guanylyltransferase